MWAFVKNKAIPVEIIGMKDDICIDKNGGKWLKSNLEFLKPTPEDRVKMAIHLFPDVKKNYTHDELEGSLDIVNDLIKIAYGESDL